MKAAPDQRPSRASLTASPKRIERAASLYSAGMTMQAIAAELEVSIATVQKDLKRAGVHRPRVLRAVPPCGRPGCRNESCDTEPGRCHVPGCDDNVETTAAGYRPLNCQKHAGAKGGRVLIVCEVCGTETLRYRSEAAVNQRALCGRRECYDTAQRKHPDPGLVVCAREGCIESFRPSAARAARASKLYHSPECHAADKAVHPDVGERICAREGCGRTFKPTRWKAARGQGRYCSTECYAERTGETEERVCARAGCTETFDARPSEADRRYCTQECWGLDRWQRGIALERNIAGMPGRARQRWLGRYGGRAAGKLGGRPRVDLTSEQVVEVQRLVEQGWGRRAIASRLGVSERAVRNALSP